MLVNLKEILAEAESKKYGIPCINTPNMGYSQSCDRSG